MNPMITRREFTKTLSGAAALLTLNPIIGWAVDADKVSAEAARIYHDSFILDGNALADVLFGDYAPSVNSAYMTRPLGQAAR